MTLALFIDTFSHESVEEVNLDLVQFPRPVIIRDIRCVHAGSRVDLQSVKRIGATSPRSFQLEIFVNNLSSPGASAFKKLGDLMYNADTDSRFLPKTLVPTDGLIIRGKYTSVTLAVFGELAQEETQTQHSSTIQPLGQSFDHDKQMPEQNVIPRINLAQKPVSISAGTGPHMHITHNMPPQIGMPPVHMPQPPMNMPPHFGPPSMPGQMRHPMPMPGMPPPFPMPPVNALGQPPPFMPPPMPFAPHQGPMTANVGQPFMNNPFGPTFPPMGMPPPMRMDAPPMGMVASQQPPVLATSTSHQQQPPPQQKHNEDNETVEKKTTVQTHALTTVGHGLPGSLSESGGSDSQLEEGEYAASEDSNAEGFDYENISDDEFEFDESAAQDMDFSDMNEDFLKPATTIFMAHQFEVSPLVYFTPPFFSEYEVEKYTMTLKYLDDEVPDSAQRIMLVVSRFKNQEHGADWVQCLETLPEHITTGLVYIVEKLGRQDIVKILVSWAMEGVDFKLALQQEQPVFKLRHMKAGLNLVAALCLCDCVIAKQLLTKNVHAKLVEMFNAPYMTQPMKLNIVQCMVATLFFREGCEVFLASSIEESVDGLSAYQRLVESMLQKQASRVVAAVGCVLNIVNIYETLTSFVDMTKSLTAATKSEGEGTAIDEKIQQEQLRFVCLALRELTSVLESGKFSLADPKRTLPCKVVFEVQVPPKDSCSYVFRMFESCHLIEALSVLCSHEYACTSAEFLRDLTDFLTVLMSSHDGLVFLSSQLEATNNLLRLMLQSTTEEGHDSLDDSPLQQLGVELAHHLQALHYVDELMHFHKSGVVQLEVDNAGVLSTLHNLYSLTSARGSAQAHRAVVNALSLGTNLDALLPFVELTGDNDWDSKIRKSACAGYATELLLTVLRNSESTSMLQRFCEKLLLLSSQDATSKISEVKQWVEVMRKMPAFTYEAVPYLAEQLKVYAQESISAKIPRGLITILRILRSLVVAPKRLPLGEPEELKYKYAVMQLHAADAFTPLVQLLDKLLEIQLFLWQQGLSLNSVRGRILLATIRPALAIMRAVLSYAIMCKGDDFKDVTAVPTLMQLYTVTCTLISAGSITKEIQEMRDDVVQTLLAYTQPDTRASLSSFNTGDDLNASEALKSSLWTQMVDQVIEFTLKSPYAFIGGLNALSEMLPLLLPMQMREPLRDNEAAVIESTRCLWSAHLMALTSQLQRMIGSLAPSTFTQLQQSLRRLCMQLSDLSPAMALVVTKALLDVFFEFALKPVERQPVEEATVQPAEDGATASSTKQDEGLTGAEVAPADTLVVPPSIPSNVESRVIKESDVLLPAPANLAHVLNLMSNCLLHAPMKHALLHLAHKRADTPEDIYSQAFMVLLTVFNHVSNQHHHLMCQEHISTIMLRSLCDEELSLMENTGDDDTPVTLEQLASSLPDQELLCSICTALMSHIGNAEFGFASVIHSLRTLVVLTEHDYGLYHIKMALQSEGGALLRLLNRLSQQFSRDSSDHISTLSTTMELLRSVMHLPANTQHPADLRSKCLDFGFLREVLEWKYGGRQSNERHPLMQLERDLEKNATEDVSLNSLLENMKKLISDLSEASASANTEFERPVLPASASLQTLFSNRQLWQLCGEVDDDRSLSMQYWLPPCTIDDEEDVDADKVALDLELLRLRYFPHFSLTEELITKLSTKHTEAGGSKRRTKPVIINTARGERKPFVAPMRGRGFITRGGAQGGRVHDPFRNRPPNTSRPPSMHVDDFVVLQSHAVADTPTPPSGAGRGGARDTSKGRSDRTRMKRPGDNKMLPPPSIRDRGGRHSRPSSISKPSESRKFARSSAYDDRLRERSHRSRQTSPRSSSSTRRRSYRSPK